MSTDPKPCAYCGKAPRQSEFTPFCSRGCQDRDLLKWLDGSYVAPRPLTDEDSASEGLDSTPRPD